MDKATVEGWLRDYGLVQYLTDEQYQQFVTQYDNDNVDAIDDGEEFYVWCEEFCDLL